MTTPQVPELPKKETPKDGDIKALIASDGWKRQFAAALPKHITADRMVRVALTALHKTPKLMQCTKESLFECLLDLSQIGLEPNGRDAHLIPYGDQCKMIVDYKGYAKLAHESKCVSDIHCDVVCENDFFEYAYGTNKHLTHRPAREKRGKVVQAYSFVTMKDGSESFEVMNLEELNLIRERSKAKSSGPWVTDTNEMYKKTPFRRHSKVLPLGSRFQLANEKDFDSVVVDITPKKQIAMPTATESGVPVSANHAEAQAT
jgi:recombination protein RecT